MPYIPIIARIDSLPPLPESVVKIESLFSQGDPDINEIVKIIESDPALTTDILAKVNAPFYGFTKTIISILQAVTLFGASKIRSIVLASSLQRNFDINLSPYDISTSDFAKITSIQSDLMSQWYMSIDVQMARELSSIAFLMETGKILIAKDVLDSDKKEDFINDLITYKDVSYVENFHTMMTCAQINALVFKHLNLHTSFYELMQYMDDQQETPAQFKDRVLALRVVRAAINVREVLSEKSINNALELLEGSSLNKEGFTRVIKRLQAKYL